MRKLALVFLFFLILSSVFAVSASFNYNTKTGSIGTTYNWIDASSGTELSLGDDSSANVQWPFDFEIYDDTYTGGTDNISVCSNGFMRFDGNADTDYEVASDYDLTEYATDLGQIIAVGINDCSLEEANSNLYYKVTGSSPNRILTIEYHNLEITYDDDKYVDIEVQFYEYSNKIVILFGDDDVTQNSADVGIHSGVDGFYYKWGDITTLANQTWLELKRVNIKNPDPANNAQNVAPSYTTLNWDDVSGATGYHISIGTTSGGTDIADSVAISGGTNSFYTVSNYWNYNTTYYWRVTANYADTTSEQGAEWRFTTVSGTAQNPSPTNGATGVLPSQRTLSWDVVTDCEGYYITIGTTSGGTDIVDSLYIAGENNNFYRYAQNWSYSTTYYWHITTKPTVGSDIVGDEWSFTTSDPPTQATNPSPADGSSDIYENYQLSWNLDSNTNYIDLYFSSDSLKVATNDTTVLKLQNSSATSYNPGTMNYSTTYYWKIVSKDTLSRAEINGNVWRFTVRDEEFISSYPYTQNFDAFPDGITQYIISDNWVNIENGDDGDWTVNSGGTPSSGTGPTADHTSGSGKYLYLEASSGENPGNPNKSAYLYSPRFELYSEKTYTVGFWYNMYGNNMGSLYVDICNDSAMVQNVWSKSGDQGTDWHYASFQITGYSGKYRIRFQGITGSSYRSDMAVDDFSIEIQVVPVTNPVPANGATMVARDTNLSWDANPAADYYKISLWYDDADKTNHYVCQDKNIGNVTTYDPSDDGVDNLNAYEVYYWKVTPVQDGIEPDSVETWSFTTEPNIQTQTIAGKCLSFSGGNKYVVCDTSVVITGTQPRSYEFWAYTEAFDEGGIFQAGITGSVGQDFSFRTTSTDDNWWVQLWGSPDFGVTLPGSKNSWHHYCITYNGSAVKVYYDGNLMITNNVTINTTSHELYIGRWSANYFNGKIDEFAVWNKELSQDEIRQKMHLTHTGNESGLIGYWQFNETSGTTVIDAMGRYNGTMYNMTDSDRIDSPIPIGPGYCFSQAVTTIGNYTFTNTDLSMNITSISGTDTIYVTKIDTMPYSEPTHYYEIYDSQYWIIDSYGNNNFTANITCKPAESINPVLNYSLYQKDTKDNTDWSKISSEFSFDQANNTLTFDNVSTDGEFIVLGNLADSNRGYALDFNGTDQYVQVDSISQILGNNPRTIEAWAYTRSFNDGGIFQTGVPTVNGGEFSLRTKTTDNEWRVQCWGSDYDFDVTLPNSKNGWHHYCLTYDGSVTKLYYDGDLVGEKNENLNTLSNQNYFGRWRDNYFDGQIDEVRFWDKAKTASEIREDMYKTLQGNEDGLIGYWQFNDGSGNTLQELISSKDGTLYNMDDSNWISSNMPMPVTAFDINTIGATGNYDFTDTNLSMNVTSKTGTDTFLVALIEYEPSDLPTGVESILDNQYWVINQYGSGTFVADITFKPSDTLSAVSGNLCLYRREIGQSGGWQLYQRYKHQYSSGNEFVFDDINQEGEYILCMDKDVSANLGNALDFDGVDDYVNCGYNVVPTGNSAKTIELWAYVRSFNWAGLFQSGSFSTGKDFSLRVTDTEDNWWVQLWGSPDFGVTLPGSKNSWHHYCLTYDGETVKMYYDGNLAGSKAVSLNTGNGEFYIGKWSSNYFDGMIDEVAVWNVARTQEQICSDMHHFLQGNENGLINYWQFNQNSGTTLYNAINVSNGTLNNMNDSDWIVSNAVVGDGTSDFKVIGTTGSYNFSGTSFSMNVTQKSFTDTFSVSLINNAPYNPPTEVEEVFDDQYWVMHHYGGGSFTSDITFTVSEAINSNNSYVLYQRESGNLDSWQIISTANTIDIANRQITFPDISESGEFVICRTLLSPIPGYAMNFNGSNQYVEVPYSSSLNPDNFTVMFWAKVKGGSGNWRSPITSRDNEPERGYVFYANYQDKWQFMVGEGGGWKNIYGPDVVENEWVFVAGTYDGNTLKLYVNGQKSSELSSVNYVKNSARPLRIGAGKTESSPSYFFNGDVDEISIWNRALSPNEIRERMHHPLLGTQNGLVAHWDFNKKTGSTVYDYIASHNGTMQNMNDNNRVESTIPFGNGEVYTQIISTTGTVTFGNTDFIFDVTSKTGVDTFVVTKIEQAPYNEPTQYNRSLGNEYWIFEKYGTGSVSAKATFTISDNIPSERIKLYKRGAQSDGDWQFVTFADSTDSADKKVYFNSLTQTAQYVIRKLSDNASIALFDKDNSYMEFEQVSNQILGGMEYVPVVYDIDNDGFLDLLTGYNSGYISHYEQKIENPYQFDLRTYQFNNIDVGVYATPELTDIDGDGLLDLLIGENDGNINRYEQASANSYTFNLVTENFAGIDVSMNSAPRILDLDNDGRLELFVSSYAHIYYYKQDSSHSTSFTLVTNNFCNISDLQTKLAFYDLDNDGLTDMLVGKTDGTIDRYEQDGVNSLNFVKITSNISGIDVGDDAAPYITDLNNDALADLVVGTEVGRRKIFKQKSYSQMDLGEIIPNKTYYSNYKIKARHLRDNIYISCSQNLYVSLNENGPYTSNLLINKEDGDFDKTIYVKVVVSQRSDFSGTITHVSNNTETRTLTVSGDYTYTDEIAGNCLDFDGSDDYVSCPSSAQVIGNNSRTIEAWAYTESFNDGGLFQAGITGVTDKDFSLRTINGADNQWRVQLWGSSDFDVTLPNSKNNWHHYALTYDGTTIKLYYDGELKGMKTVNLDTGSHDIWFGRWDNFYFHGKIDEVSVWNIARTQEQIRADMHLSLNGTENGLVAYWQLNSESGNTATELVGKYNGTLNNMDDSDWVTSYIPLGGGYSDNHIVASTGVVSFDSTNVSMNFTEKTSTDTFFVYKINHRPVDLPSDVDSVLYSQYWVIRKYGNGTFNANITFTNTENFPDYYQNIPSYVQLYHRDENSIGSWTYLASASDVSGSVATFDNISQTGQFIICYNENPSKIITMTSPTDFELKSDDFNNISIGTYLAPTFYDIDNDGLIDMLVGEENGNINHYEQASKNSSQFNLITENFNSISAYNKSAPILVDLDHDGLLDLLIGYNYGKLMHYKQAAQNSYTFNLVTDNFGGFDVGSDAYPTVADIDNDGLYDLFVGNTYGKIYHYKQVYSDSLDFNFITSMFSSIDVGTNAKPVMIDLANNNLYDLIVGENYYNVDYYVQSSTDPDTFDIKSFSLFDELENQNKMIGISDFDHDGLFDMVVGSDSTGLSYYEQAQIDTLDFKTVKVGNTVVKKFFIKGENLTSDISITSSSTDFEISFDRSSGYSQTLTGNIVNGGFSDTLFVRFSPSSAANYNGKITLTATGADKKEITVIGTGGSVDRYAGKCLSFNGIQGYVNCGNEVQITGNNPRTIEMWAYTRSFNDGGLFFAGNLWETGGDFALRTKTTDDNWRLQLWGTADVDVVLSGSKNSWHHYCVTYDGSTIKLYYDGNLMIDEAKTLDTGEYNLYIGRWATSIFDGDIDEFAVWNRALTQDEIRKRMYLTLSGTENGLLAYWQFNEVSGTEIIDKVGAHTATIIGGVTKVDANEPVGGGVSALKIVSANGSVLFDNTNLTMDFYNLSSSGTFVVSRIDTFPNLTPTDSLGNNYDVVYNNQYWVIRNYENVNFDAHTTFTLNENLKYKADVYTDEFILCNRDKNSALSWTELTSPVLIDTLNKTIKMDDINSEGQFIFVRNYINPPVPHNVDLQISGGNLVISWDASDSTDTYKVIASDTPNGTYQDVTNSGTFGTTTRNSLAAQNMLFALKLKKTSRNKLGLSSQRDRNRSRITWTLTNPNETKKFYKIISVRNIGDKNQNPILLKPKERIMVR